MNASPLQVVGIVVLATGVIGSFVAWWQVLRRATRIEEDPADLRSDRGRDDSPHVPPVFEAAFGRPRSAEPPRVSGLVLVGAIAVWLLAQILAHAWVFPPDAQAPASSAAGAISEGTSRSEAEPEAEPARAAVPDASKGPPEKRLLVLCGSQIATLLLVPWLLTEGGRRSLAEYGISAARWSESLFAGFWGFSLALAPVMLVLIASNPWRSDEQQNPLLQWLRNDPDPLLAAGIVLSATVLAPLMEELLFRVLAQGWLRQWMRPGWAIAVSSAAFALVHGWPDSVALVPLAVVLGQAYERTTNYLVVVSIHSIFNTFNLFLALTLTLGSPPEEPAPTTAPPETASVGRIDPDDGNDEEAEASSGERSMFGCRAARGSVSSPASIAEGSRVRREPRGVQHRDGRTWPTQHN